MQVIKILRVESPIHLWTILKNREEVFESKNELIYFLDCVDTYVNGCKCDEDLNYDNMISSYSDIKNNSDLIIYLTNSFDCNEIRFLK
jgi:hypothetical protein